ncbi:MAG: ribbon-helix-helix protein, CopG family [Candidatus Aenigmatarchaeota archaeon]
MAKKRTTLYLREDLWKKLRHLSIDQEKSTSQLLEEIVESHLKKMK